jgi:hypothetical protein
LVETTGYLPSHNRLDFYIILLLNQTSEIDIMSDYGYNPVGQINGAGDERALFLKQFAGEILSVMPESQNSLGMTFKKVLKGAKSYQFPYLGKLTAKYHTPGVQLTGQATGQNEKVISLDSLLVVDRFVAKVL